jgi:hypothetical protein
LEVDGAEVGMSSAADSIDRSTVIEVATDAVSAPVDGRVLGAIAPRVTAVAVVVLG